jgi:HSP20 family molecular chaperone IbpA
MAAKELIKRAETSTEKTHKRRKLIPSVDVIENHNEYVLYADLPGVEEKVLDVILEKEVLTIKAEAHEEVPEGYTQKFTEFSPGIFERSFSVSDDIDRDRIKATIKNGVLKVILPKAETARAKKIEITQG